MTSLAVSTGVWQTDKRTDRQIGIFPYHSVRYVSASRDNIGTQKHLILTGAIIIIVVLSHISS